MAAVREFLDNLPQHKHDPKWLAAHADRLYNTLESALNQPPQVNDAIEGLIAICPYVFTRSDFKRWSSLLFDALINAQLLQDDQLQARVWAQMGESYYMAGQHSEARQAFETALERARQGRTQEMLLAAYIGIIKLQSYRLDEGFNIEFVQEALLLARQVGDLTLQMQLFTALTFVFTRRQETQTAINYGQMAYIYWHKTGNVLETARTALMLADAYRLAENMAQAERFLEVAASLFTEVEYARSYWLIAYETGVLYLHHQEYVSAQQWLMLALREADKLDHPYNLALSYHSLGIAETGLKRFDAAAKSLQSALSIWEKLDHLHYRAHVYQALGYLEGQRGNIQEAFDYLHAAQRVCSQTPEMHAREYLEKLIADSIAELNELT
jgi:tetratricopeptide (TPR) repeat protein